MVAVLAIWSLLLLAAVTTLTAAAAPKGGGLGAFAIFDMADNRGIRVSQYELSIDTGQIINPLKIWLAQRLLTGWDIYRYSIGLMAYIVDWTISMSWLSVITAPLQEAATQIRDHVIGPSGLAGLMLLLSAAVGGVRMVFGRVGAGLWDIVSALAVATAVSLLLVSPVSAVTGAPLTKVRNTGVAIAAMIDNGGVLAATDINASDAQAKLNAGPVLIDSLVRPAHGLVNYGVNFTADQKCTPTYDQALKAGPYWDPEAAKQREAVAGCDKTLGKYADNAIYTATLGMGVFLVTGFLVGGLILVASALLFIAVMMLAWNLLKLVVTGVIGIGPGDTRGPLIRNACQAAASLVYVGVSIIVLAVILVLIKKSFSAADTAPMVRFLLADVVIIAGLVVVVQTWLAHRRGADSWAQKLMTRMKQTAPKPTIGAKVGSWLKAPAGGEAGKYGDLGGAGPAGGWGGSSSRGMGVGRMLRPITHSNASSWPSSPGSRQPPGERVPSPAPPQRCAAPPREPSSSLRGRGPPTTSTALTARSRPAPATPPPATGPTPSSTTLSEPAPGCTARPPPQPRVQRPPQRCTSAATTAPPPSRARPPGHQPTTAAKRPAGAGSGSRSRSSCADSTAPPVPQAAPPQGQPTPPERRSAPQPSTAPRTAGRPAPAPPSRPQAGRSNTSPPAASRAAAGSVNSPHDHLKLI